jgi:hypothetical protein
VTTVTARRLVLSRGELAGLSVRLGLTLPPGFPARPEPVTTPGVLLDGEVRPSVAAGLAAACAPQVAVLLTAGDAAAVFGIAGDLGGSLLGAGDSPVEVSAWPAAQLGAELARAVPPRPDLERPPRHRPLTELAADAELQALVMSTLRATVVAPPHVLGQVIWLDTRAGWLALEPSEVRNGVRWATTRPVGPADLGACVAPFAAAALA